LYINWKGETQRWGANLFAILQLRVQRGASIEGMPNVPNKFVDAPINRAPLKIKF
jgi:hypothetical protein